MTNGNNTPRAMDIEQVREYTLSLYGVTEDQPFGDDNIVFRIESKIFMCLWLGEDVDTTGDR
ncbi:MmcQ/YjbR family DNA-binding protein, partial [Prevotella sp.]